MVERFTEKARRVVVLATEEARRRRHVAVGPEHLFASLVRDGDALGGKWFEYLRVSSERVSAEIERVMTAMPGSATGDDPPFSPELKAVLHGALEEQRRRRYPFEVSPELLLLGLLADEHSTVSRILHAAGVDLERARLLIRLPFNNPITEDQVRFIATSTWRVQIGGTS
jgi:ATP-dependent Clp protease ATP-binding subunit ClpC